MREKHDVVFSRLMLASLLTLALSSLAFAQGGARGGGSHPGGGPGVGGGGGFPPGMSRDTSTTGDRPSGRPDGDRRNGSNDPESTRQQNSEQADRDLHRHPDIARLLNTTPSELRSQYQTALAANPNLTFGQFIAANLIANNLSAAHPKITTAAILSGLASGQNLGQVLQSLGLSAQEAKDAIHEAKRAAKNRS